MSKKSISNTNASARWNRRAVGGQRSAAEVGSKAYFEDVKAYRYGYETPFIPRIMTVNVDGKRLLEIGTGLGIDACEMIRNGCSYTGLDITRNHLDLTKKNIELNGLKLDKLIEADLLDVEFEEKFDVVYSFGVMHHIHHEDEYIRKIRTILREGGELRVAVYSKYSFFNIYMFATWIFKHRCKHSFSHWQGFVSDGANFDMPITIKIRSKKDVIDLYKANGFEIKSYYKKGFVQNYLPLFGGLLKPDGKILNSLGSILGWYHILILKVK